MMATLARLRATTRLERWLLVEAVALLGAASLAIAIMPFQRVAGLARAPRNPTRGDDELRRQVRVVSWAVTAAARRVPWRAKCIEQGFAAHWMLHRRAIPSVLHYGVARREAGLIAHVWVRAGSIDVVGCENHADFAEVAQFPPSSR